ncbi:MAG: T9SS type A sorting domain-containing protein, partial [Bacteroidota bacterium]
LFTLLLSISTAIGQDCQIFNVVAEAHACDDQGNFLVDIAFEHQSTTNQFQITGNGNDYGTFTYGSPFYTVGPIPGDGNTPLTFVLTDLVFGNCSGEISIEPVNCNASNCGLSEIIVDQQDCDPSGNYGLFVNVLHDNIPNESVDISINEELIGSFPLSQLPTIIEGISPNENGIESIQVCLSDAPDCCLSTFYDAPCESGNQCQISGLFVEPHNCDDQGGFMLDVAFQYANTSDLFTIIANDMVLGTFQYEQTVYTVGPLNGDGTTTWEISVVDAGQNDCSASTILAPVDCDPNGGCGLLELIVDPGACNNDGTYDLFVNIEHNNSPDDLVEININNASIGFFPLGQLPTTLQLDPNDLPVSMIEICLVDAPNCCIFADYITPDCNGSGDCSYSNVGFEVQPCDAQGNFLVDVGFNVQNPGGSFTIFANGMSFGPFDYGDNFYTFGPLQGGPNAIYQVTIQDNDNNCSAALLIENDCNVGACAIFEPTAEAQACDEQGNFFVHIAFEAQNTSDLFQISANGAVLGTFAYGDPFYTVGPFQNNGGSIDFLITDLGIDNCEAIAFLEAFECQPSGSCGLLELMVNTGPCNNNGSYNLTVNVEHNNSPDDLVEININNESIGFFPLGQLPTTLQVDPSDLLVSTIEVCLVDFPNCCLFTDYETPNCNGGGDCSYSNFGFNAQPCDAQGNFFVDIGFNVQNPGSSFTIFANGTSFGPFDYGNNFYTIGPLQGGPNAVYQVTIQDNDNNCSAAVVIENDCSLNNCAIFEATAEPQECDEQGNFLVDITFEAQNTSDLFQISADGAVLGTFAYGDPFYTVGPFQNNGSGIDFLITDLGIDNCEAVASLEAFECQPSGTCGLSELIVDPGACNNDGSYDLFINVTYNNPPDDLVELSINNAFIGLFPLNQLPTTLPVEPSNQTLGTVQVCLVDFPDDCCLLVDYQVPDCNNGSCGINAIEVYPISCNGDGSYSLLIDLDYNSNVGGSFNVFSQGNTLGNFEYADLPIILPSFQSNGNLIQQIGVCDEDSPNCCIDTEFEGLICDNCEYWNIEASPGDCQADGTFPIELDFEHQGGGPYFSVLANGQTQGIFLYSDLPVSFGSFPGDGISTINLIIVDLTNPFCNFSWEVQTIECGGIPPASPVWPGDADDDNIANHLDLLSLGLTYGLEGPSRPNNDIGWQAMAALDWPGTFINGINHKNADCNGDGIVDDQDLFAIENNYGLTHGPVLPFVGVTSSPNDPALFVDLPSENDLSIGTPFVAPVLLGTEDLPIDNIYGLAFTIEFDPTVLDPNQTFVEVVPNWMGTPDTDLISINRTLADQGIIEVALSRIDQQNVGGHGPIAHFIGIIDDVLGKTEVEVNIRDIRAITAEEQAVPLHNPEQVVILTNTTNTENVIEGLMVFPNPTNDFLHIQNESNQPVDAVRIYNVLGQQLRVLKQFNDSQIINVANWTPGIYFVRLEVGVESQTVKIVVE